MTVGDVELVAAITRGAAEALGLKAGDAVKAVIKSTEVMIVLDPRQFRCHISRKSTRPGSRA